MVIGSPHHSSSWPHRSLRFPNQDARGRVDGKPSFPHHVGIFSLYKEFMRSSIGPDIVSSPLKPSWSSNNERVISPVSAPMYVHSCKKTNWYGPFSSSLRLRWMSSTGNLISRT